MFKHLEQMGFIQAHTNIKARTVTLVDGRLCYSHFHIEDHPGHWDMIDDVCITTIRNPMDVFRSHDKRSPLASVLEVESKVINAFDKLDEFISRYSPTLIRVDSNESIKKEICELANSIGIDYSYKKVDAATASITVTRRLMLQQPRFEIPKSVIRLAEKYKYNTLIKESQTSCIS